MLMKVQHVAVSENSAHDSCVPFTVIWTWNFLHSVGKRDGICSMALRLHVLGFYSKRIVNIGDVSIADYLVAEVWCDRMTVVMHDCDMSCVGTQQDPKFVPSFPCWYPCLCVCLHCTVSSAYTSVHKLATHMCHLPYNCHLHSQWARLCHTKVACHIS